MGVDDVYKLVLQACEGGDHLLKDPDTFAAELRKEWANVKPVPSADSPIQRIHPSGRVARLHLRPCVQMGISLAEVAQLLLAQPLKAGTYDAFCWAWAGVLRLARRGEIPFDIEELEAVPLTRGATHHGDTYGFAAYRILNDLSHRPTREALCRLGLLP